MYAGNSFNQRFVRPARLTDPVKKIHWFTSLTATEFNERKLHFLKPIKKQTELNIILLDTSASTLAQNSLSNAKASIKQLAEAAYLKRQAICLMTFGNERIEIILHPQRAPKNIQPLLESIGACGGTPLRKALIQVSEFIRKQNYAFEHCKLYLFTDGRSRESISTLSIDCDIMLVDTENSAVKLGLGKKLADSLNAQYVHL